MWNWKRAVFLYNKHFFFHFNHNEELITNDVGLVQLCQPIRGRSIPLCTKSYKDSFYLMVATGLSLIDPASKKKPTVLQETVLEETYHNCKRPTSEVCMKPTRSGKHSSICKGDSGGPLVVLSHFVDSKCLYGVSSYAPNKYCSGESYFDRVSYFYDWIEQNM